MSIELDAVAIALDGATDQQRNVLADISIERDRQDMRWGEQNHIPALWLAILTEEVGELATAILRHNEPESAFASRHRLVGEMRAEAIQVAAVAVQFVEYLDRQ